MTIGKIKGRALFHHKTKQLVQDIQPDQIAVVAHDDIDVTAAESLIRKKVKAVINVKCSMTGFFLNDGVHRLLKHNIQVFDVEEESGIDAWINHRYIEVIDNRLLLHYSNRWIDIGSVCEYDGKLIRSLKNKAKQNSSIAFEKFCENSIYFAEQELSSLLHCWDNWEEGKELTGKDVLIVIRGADYGKDLYYANEFFLSEEMCAIAVDGSADEMMHLGIQPDYIIGDMDSVGVTALQSGAALIVHEGLQGNAPGMQRLQKYNLSAQRVKFFGLSEDAAIAFALKEGADKIYLIGGHRDMEEYLSKGRQGMGSSLLMKMLAGSKIVDLKGIHHAFEQNNRTQRAQWWRRKLYVLFPFFASDKVQRGIRGVKV